MRVSLIIRIHCLTAMNYRCLLHTQQVYGIYWQLVNPIDDENQNDDANFLVQAKIIIMANTLFTVLYKQ